MGELDQLDDKQLIEKASELGVKICPITPSTRKILVKRIEKALIERNISMSSTNIKNFNESIRDNETDSLPIPELESAIEHKVNESADNEVLESLSHDLSKMNMQSTPTRNFLSTSNQYFLVHYSYQNSLIVNSLKEVSELAKVDPELRFRTFLNYSEAESSLISFQEEISKIYLSEFDDSHSSLPINQNGQLPPFKSWRSIPTRLLLKYRKYIEDGDVKNVLLCCLNNPRYIITSIDTPTILHEGTRRNAFHIAAEKNKAKVISILLHLMRNEMWCQACHLVPVNDNDTVEDILKNTYYPDFTMHTLDLYLNSPDKILFETPLHIACKFGSKNVVEVLLAQPEINIDPKNKYGETPYDLIGSRCDADDYDIIMENVQYLFRKN